jgi:carboxyl-terminal processing protease
VSYMREAIEAMNSGLYAEGERWSRAVEAGLSQARSATEPSELHDTIGWMNSVASGRHGWFMDPDVVGAREQRFSADAEFSVPSVVTAGEIGVLTVPAFGGTEPAARERYVLAALDSIEGAAPSVRCGWIVDLRGNTGGNVYPMLAAISPFLEDGVLLRTDSREEDGEVVVAGNTVGHTVDNGSEQAWRPVLKVAAERIAVLQDAATASSGEITAAGLAAPEDARVFGNNSAGLGTGNLTTFLSDGAALTVTTTTFTDANGDAVTGGAPVDVMTDEPVEDAQRWLTEECS